MALNENISTFDFPDKLIANLRKMDKFWIFYKVCNIVHKTLGVLKWTLRAFLQQCM